MLTVVMDLETLPCSDAGLIAEIQASVKPPKTLKKAESIAAWWAEEGEQAKADAVHRTGLDGAYGRILAIGFAIEHHEPFCIIDADEKKVISEFYRVLNNAVEVEHAKGYATQQVTFVGHNIIGFDFRFLWQRSVVNGITPPAYIPFGAKDWDKSVFDTMTKWNPDREKRTSLDKLCKILGVKSPKGDIDGSKVAQAWADGRGDEIAEYCCGDVRATRSIYQRLTFTGQPALLKAA